MANVSYYTCVKYALVAEVGGMNTEIINRLEQSKIVDRS